MRADLNTLIATALVTAKGDVDKATAAVVDRLTADDLRQMAYELVRPRVATAHRAGVRTTERIVFNSATDSETRAEQMMRLREETGFVPGYGPLKWGQMTAEQHIARASMLRGKATGHIETAKRHEAAAEQIRMAGVRCLDDLSKMRRAA